MRGGVGGMFPFVALARISMLRNMMDSCPRKNFTKRQSQFRVAELRSVMAVSANTCPSRIPRDPRTISASRMKKRIWGVLAEIPEIFNPGTT